MHLSANGFEKCQSSQKEISESFSDTFWQRKKLIEQNDKSLFDLRFLLVNAV